MGKKKLNKKIKLLIKRIEKIEKKEVNHRTIGFQQCSNMENPPETWGY